MLIDRKLPTVRHCTKTEGICKDTSSKYLSHDISICSKNKFKTIDFESTNRIKQIAYVRTEGVLYLSYYSKKRCGVRIKQSEVLDKVSSSICFFICTTGLIK